ncbi:hypothetical protein PM082_001632 [Marasmius tenuissimus]|nr:hypothetical protein PM082_001632 [Marasmius tenuissimus]
MTLQPLEIAGVVLGITVPTLAFSAIGTLIYVRKNRTKYQDPIQYAYQVEKCPYPLSPSSSVSSLSIPLPTVPPFNSDSDHQRRHSSSTSSSDDDDSNAHTTKPTIVFAGPSVSDLSCISDNDTYSVPSQRNRRDSWPPTNLSITTDPGLKAAEDDLKRALSIYTIETSSMYSLASASPELHERYLPRRTLSRAPSCVSYISYARSVNAPEGSGAGSTAVPVEEPASSNRAMHRQLHAGMPLPPIPVPARLKPNKRGVRPLPPPPPRYDPERSNLRNVLVTVEE